MKNKILVLDDDSRVAKTIKKLLTKYCYEVSWVRNTDEASRFLKTNEIDLVIVDYRLQGDSGIHWMTSMRESGFFMPFILLSGFSMNSDAQKRLRNLLGVRYILEKPIDFNRFIESVAVAITQSHEDIEVLFNNASREKRVRRFSDTSSIALQEVIKAVQEKKKERGEEEEFDLATFLTEASEYQENFEHFDVEDSLELPSASLEETGDFPCFKKQEEDPFDADLEESLMELRLEYLHDLPDLLRGLADRLEIAAAHGWEQRDILDALIQAHNIKGSSGSHSLMIVSELAA
ncbi:MAG: response regulator [Cyanobacteriota/Melainabacteria group bacterium]